MKNLSKNLLFVLGYITLFLSCTKGDTPTDNPVGGDAFKTQVVTIDLPNTSLPNSEYHGSMGNVEITLTKGDEHKLLFMVPSTMALGIQDLVINDLGNMKISYNVKEPTLPDSPDAILSSFQSNMNTFQATSQGNISTQKAIDSFNQVYANASDEEKNKMATLYYVNKAIFDDIVLNDYSSISGRSSNCDGMANLLKHKAALLAVAVGVVIVVAPLTPIEKVAGAALVVIGLYKSYQFWSNFASCKLNTIQLKINELFGKNSTTSSALILNNNVGQNLTFNSVDRTVISSDSDKQNSGIQLCFTYHNLYNQFANQTNPVIEWINNNVPFTNFDSILLEVVPTTSDSINNPINSVTYSHLTFSINDPNIILVSSSLSSTGQLNLKVKINGTATSVNSTLHYTFSDEFSTFSGSFPIIVSINNTETVTIGSQVWMLKNLDVDHYRNGDPIPQVTDPAAWGSLTTGAWCYYENNTANGPIYGKLYNWYAVNDPRGLAPQGYHVPSHSEWSVLTDYLGGETVAGGKMKSTGTSLWQSPNTDATNASGFTGLPAGYRNYGGPFYSIGIGGFWWSSSEGNTTVAWFRNLLCVDGNAYRDYDDKRFGYSVRCLRD